MGEVALSINGRSYPVACDDGQERRVRDLGKFVDERLREIARAGAANNELHLLVLTALMLADENFDLRTHVGNLQQGMQDLEAQVQAGPVAPGMAPDEEAEIAAAIDELASRIEHIAGRVQRA
ncbi:MAG: cell division protein ZapA [Alphaproteobacteria bacterium]|nr:cell division protein ZapA [Alphaproteobacteria bacterium]